MHFTFYLNTVSIRMQSSRFIVCVLLMGVSVAFGNPLDSESNSEISSEISNTETIPRNENISANDPIECDVGYEYYQTLYSNWSNTKDCIDDKQRYFLIDYTEYATSFEDFVKLYPTLSIYTEGKALLKITFGDDVDYLPDSDLAAPGSFGELKFDTNKFDVETPTHYEYRVDHEDFIFIPGYESIAKIGIGFMKLQNKLYLKPYVKGSVTSIGALHWSLTIGLSITKLTFIPKNNSLMDNVDINY